VRDETAQEPVVNREPKDSPVRELESRAIRLYDGIAAQDAHCLGRIRSQVPRLVKANSQEINIEHARTTVAREAGFKTWQMATEVLEGRSVPGDDFGEFWYSTATDVMLSHWCRNYQEAHAVHEEEGGFLIPYRRHFAVVEKAYVEILGMDCDDPDWQTVGHDVAQPRDKMGYRRLALRRLEQIQPHTKKATIRWVCLGK
jgi:hypothetical protein